MIRLYVVLILLGMAAMCNQLVQQPDAQGATKEQVWEYEAP